MTGIQVVQGDITSFEVDAIVNAANSALSGGGGVDGAIHKAAGVELLEACRVLGRCPTGEARITPGFLLPAKYVIHAVGPVWSGGQRNEEQLLSSCYHSALMLAHKYQIQSIAFPAISCGAYRFPIDKAAQVAIETMYHFHSTHALPTSIQMVCFEDKTFRAFSQAVSDLEHAMRPLPT